MRKFLGGVAAAALIALSSGAHAQLTTAPTAITTTNPSTDLVPFVPGGRAGPSQQYTLPNYIAGAPAYVDEGAVGTAWSFTFPNGVTDFIIRPTGTLATGTITTAPNPVDGQRECFLSTQTQTAITWTANTGQTVTGAATAGVANTPQCMVYEAPVQTWYRSP